MTTLLRSFWQSLVGQERSEIEEISIPTIERAPAQTHPEILIDPGDAIIDYFQRTPNAVEVDKLSLDSPALSELKAAGVKLVVPLISQGELIGLLNLGPRLSEQEYSTDDRKLLNDLATQASPAVRVAQLVRQQQAEARERERIEQELRVARIIQQTLLPKELPAIQGWHVSAYYQPARAVGGDFYDFLQFPDGRLGLFVGDVTDKGVPAALVMATTRSILRSAAERYISPGQVLEKANDLLCPDIPDNMFVTCLYALLDPKEGKMRFANAGHNLPCRRRRDGVDELRATGMPLGLMTSMQYEEKEVSLNQGETILFYSDGLTEAHNPQHEMFGFPRLQSVVTECTESAGLIDHLLNALKNFTGNDWEQEDDVTFVTLEYEQPESPEIDSAVHRTASNDNWRVLADFDVPSQPGNERIVIERISEILKGVHLSARCLEKLETAVGEATMNAMEHGNKYQEDKPVYIKICTDNRAVSVKITDHGGSQTIPEPETPDLEAKLAGLQTPRGWGLFLIKNMVDEMNVTSDETHHTVELIMNLEGDQNANQDT
ncbi:MAG TPA: SpoIIE family protein phosphatase [Anaerolineales bacterium]|jgi:serine phosphatase RsbU (regulator of sigma subunit)/anti-sigma regulatory factor (Ser/Thr protein kinase)|nr:SpoIIE family protein phosphatase [Anaerolineales bacterium]